MTLSIIIPAFNEQRTVRQVVKEAVNASLPDGMNREIIVINDGSTDQTGEILESLRTELGIRVFSQANHGKTAAIKVGLEAASGDFLLIQDADLEYSPKEYIKLFEPILSGKAQVVYGSRFLGTISKMTPINRLANRISNITFNLFHRTHLTDINTCFKLFPRSVFDKIEITSTDFTFETEITSKLIKQGYTLVEVPIDYEARSEEMGKKINPSKAILMYCGIFRYWRG